MALHPEKATLLHICGVQVDPLATLDPGPRIKTDKQSFAGRRPQRLAQVAGHKYYK